MDDKTTVDYKHITDSIFIPALKRLGFRIQSRSKYEYFFIFKDNNQNRFIIEKKKLENAISFYFSRPGILRYAMRNIIIVVGDEPYKSMHINAPDKYYYDTDEELIGIYDFAYGVISKTINTFYYGDLVDKIKEYFLVQKNKAESEKRDRIEEFKKIVQYMMDWEKVRFTERHYL
jgi:hypothetical protein